MDIRGYSWISGDIRGYSWIMFREVGVVVDVGCEKNTEILGFLGRFELFFPCNNYSGVFVDISGYPWIFVDIRG